MDGIWSWPYQAVASSCALSLLHSELLKPDPGRFPGVVSIVISGVNERMKREWNIGVALQNDPISYGNLLLGSSVLDTMSEESNLEPKHKLASRRKKKIELASAEYSKLVN